MKRLKFVPAKFEVVDEVTYVYSCPECGSMKRPEKTLPLISGGSIATPSLVAGIMNAKYVNGMPLARQEREFARYNLNLSTKTMANWIICCADRYLNPLYDRMREAFLKSRYIHCDETRIQVIGEPDQKGSTQNWMWVYLTDGYSGSPQMALFDYEINCSRGWTACQKNSERKIINNLSHLFCQVAFSINQGTSDYLLTSIVSAMSRWLIPLAYIESTLS